MSASDAVTGWDHEFDVVIVGSGYAGMVAALAARYFGLDPVVVEKASRYGGSSALSGGGVWVPNNPVNVRSGVRDTREKARRYLLEILGDDAVPARVDAFLDAGPEMIGFLEGHTQLHHRRVPGYADYHPELPGGDADGRTMEPVPFDLRRLGGEAERLNRTELMQAPAGMVIDQGDYRKLTLVMRTWTGRATAAKVGARTVLNRLRKRQMVALGAAGVARLRLSLQEAGIPLWLETPLTELVGENGRVDGVRVSRNGTPRAIRARRGVLLASGGFERNEEMRRKYQAAPIGTTWTSGAATNTGDGIRAGVEAGGTLSLMDDAWWGPTVMFGEHPMFLLAERSLPGAIVVNGDGRRYVNEACPYVNFVHASYEGEHTGIRHIPSYLIFDNTYRSRYPFSAIPPRKPFPRSWVKGGVVKVGESVEDLASKIGVPQANLTETLERYNGFVAGGRDLDYGKGDSAYDRYYGDPSIQPNPCLAPVASPPFYAFELWPGDLGTKGGLVTDEHARVLGEDGDPIPGLYAAGNTSASVMGHEYAGAGATIGPAMTFGYLAAKHLAGMDS
jgi:3-oxosteroid 1-dehydrogenase